MSRSRTYKNILILLKDTSVNSGHLDGKRGCRKSTGRPCSLDFAIVPNSFPQETDTHSASANLYPMQARFPFSGFPLRNVRIFEYNPGMHFDSCGGCSHRSGLQTPISKATNTKPVTKLNNSPENASILAPDPLTLINSLNRHSYYIAFFHLYPTPLHSVSTYPRLSSRDDISIFRAHTHRACRRGMKSQALADDPVEVREGLNICEELVCRGGWADGMEVGAEAGLAERGDGKGIKRPAEGGSCRIIPSC